MIVSQAIGVLSLTAAIAMGVRGDAVAQDPPQQPPPSVRVAVDVVPVDVSIIGNDGKPVTGLTTTDFSVDVDGRQRRLVSAQYVSTISDGAPASPSQSMFSTNTVRGGRMILFVVDRGNIAPGRGRQVTEAASRFLAKLTPADRVGLIAFPGAGPNIDFTSNHAIVQKALPGLTEGPALI